MREVFLQLYPLSQILTIMQHSFEKNTPNMLVAKQKDGLDDAGIMLEHRTIVWTETMEKINNYIIREREFFFAICYLLQNAFKYLCLDLKCTKCC